jgi:hypothetical protein
MSLRSIFSLAITILPFITIASPLEARQPCSNYVLLDTRGTNEPQGPSVAFPGIENQTLAAVPGGTTYNVVYPAGMDTEGQGGADIVCYINAGLSSCPSQKYALLGYSQGAVAVAIALSSYPPGSPGFNAISAALVVGNPTKIANKKSNVDQLGGGSTNWTTGVYTNDPNRAKLPEVWYESGKLLDVCYQDDLVCNGLTPTALLNFGVNHGKYGSTQSVQDIGARFLISRL